MRTPTPSAPTNTSAKGTMKPVIHVVEDQDDLRLSICDELKSRGYAPVGTPHGEKALSLLHGSGTKPALILLDLLMPAKDGWEVVASVKAEPRLRDVPIVVMSAIPPRSTTLQAQGIAGTLTKPFTVEELMFVVTRFVKLPGGK